MTIKRSWLIIAGITALFTASAQATPDVTPPTTITGFVASSGTLAGAVQLNWVAPSDDTAVFRYEIRYRAESELTPGNFASSSRIDAPPLNLTIPTPAFPGTHQAIVIPGLAPGVTYYFAIRPFDQAGNGSMVVISSVQAGSQCTQSPYDGEGTAVLSMGSYGVGKTEQINLTFTVGANGIQPGGKIMFRIPDFWVYPSTYYPFSIGYSSITYGGPATVEIDTISDRFITLKVNTFTMSPGEQVILSYKGHTCDVNRTAVFRTFTQAGPCGILKEIGSSPSLNTITGPERDIGFPAYEQIGQLGAITTISLRPRDGCGNFTSLSSTRTIVVSAVVDQLGTYVADPSVQISSFPSMTPLIPGNSGMMFFNVGVTSQPLYYQMNPAVSNQDRWIKLTYNDFEFDNLVNYWTRIIPISGGMTNLSVDTGALTPGQTSATFSPNGDGTNDMVYFNFNMPGDMDWRVDLSSDGFNTIVRTIWGRGAQNRIAWDGYRDWTPNEWGIAPAATYAARVSDISFSLSTTTLSVTVSAAGVAGRVVDDGSNPIPNVDIFIGQRYGRSGSDGRFSIHGLRSGNQQVRFQKSGYINEVESVTFGTTIVNMGDVEMDQASLLRVSVTRPTDVQMNELWGVARAHTADWSREAMGTVHFGSGRSMSDAGDVWSVESTTYTDLYLAPGVTYTLRIEVPSHSPVVIPGITIAAGQVDHRNPALLRRPNIEGNIYLPVGSNPNGMWVTVEAILQGGNPINNRYGGTSIPAGELTARYSVYGVENGTYTMIARAPGLVPATTTTVVSANLDVTDAHFSTMSTGGAITGVITVNGDTAALGEQFGGDESTFRMYINAWSPTTYQGSWTEVTLATHPVQTTTNYALVGLGDGDYELYVWLSGYEVSPPGPKRVTVTGGVGVLNLTFNPYSGVLRGNVTLPNGQSDYSNVNIELLQFQTGPGGGGGGPTPTVQASAGQYFMGGLGTGFYTLRAYYSHTGLIVDKNVQIANGSTTTLHLNMAGSTVTLSGRISTNARSPYNTLDYLVHETTPTQLYTNSGSTMVAANRVVAVRVKDRYQQNQNVGGGYNTYFDSKTTYFGFYDQDGNYSIQNLSPGIYRIYLNGEMDGNTGNGRELAEPATILYLSESTTLDLRLTDGYEVSGTLSIASGESEQSGRNIEISLKNTKHENIAQTQVFLNGTSADFFLYRIPPGDYLISARDYMSPAKYSAKDLRVEVKNSNVLGKQIDLLSAARIQGQLRVATSGELITFNNYQRLLPNAFRIEARSNPWFPGGHGMVNSPLIDANGQFTLAVYPGTYDIHLKSDGFIGDGAIAEGKKQFSPVIIGGITVTAGQTKNLGVIDLNEGIRVTGSVTDKNGVRLPNIPVIAYPSGSHDDSNRIEAVTNHLGSYTLHGIDPERVRYYDIVAAPRPRSNDQRYSDLQGNRYGQVRRSQVDTRNVTTVNFQLQEARGVVIGTVETPDAGPLLTPFDGETVPGAEIIMNRQGDIPQNNPLGDIESLTKPDGTFEVRGLVPGTYDLWALAQGYANALVRGIIVTDNATTDIGTIEVVAGNTMTGTLLKADGTEPTEEDVGTMVAVRDGFRDLIIGDFETDASGLVKKYKMSGFQTGRAYSLLLFNEDNDVIVLSSSITVSNATEERNFVISEAAPKVLTQAGKDNSGNVVIQFEFTKPLRNSETDLNADGTPDDSDLADRIVLETGSGTLAFADTALSSDRRRLKVTYTPGAGETTFTINVNVAFNMLNAQGEHFTADQDFIYYVGIGNSVSSRVTNVSGGTVQIENDTSEFSTQAGTFGEDADLAVEVTFRAAESVGDLTTAGAPTLGSSVMTRAKQLGTRAYPAEMAGAIHKAAEITQNPFSSFYDIFLPAGVSHFFPEGREAQLCLSYDPAASDPYGLNIYYYNPATNEYLLENENKQVDTDNGRICVTISHASVFSVFASSASILSGGGYTGELTVMNFPNPFNLKSKTVTLQDPGSLSTSQTINGTMIKFSVPSTMSGSVEIEIYNVAGERVRTLRGDVATGGSHFYMEWDGANDSGSKVASGVYIARFTLGGEERFFKMAVIK